MKLLSTVLALILFSALLSCGRNASPNKEVDALEESISQLNKSTDLDGISNKQFITDSTGTPGSYGNADQKQQPVGSQPIPKIDWDKKIIKTAHLNFEVKDYQTYYAAMRERVRSTGGYIAQEDQSQSEYKIENTLVIKVPVDQFDNALAILSGGVDKVHERKVSSEDVTSEFVDVKSRIEAKKQVRQRYMDFLKQAKNMEEVLSVQSEINGIQEEIESATGRVEYLGHSSAFSTIHLSFYQILNASAKNQENVKPSLGNRTAGALKSGWEWVVDLFVGLLSIWPLLLVVFGLIILYKRTGFRKKATT